ncbi:DUF6807 family protein [Saccharothrix syringae]|uniref:Gfo/Idh/MocA-like oxidoreductase N-terminal domain-containing protein n=1 Tax=Saccharothrix syringae TaxID=103733 RepID=A0A5Q0H1L1_SACSY|nr:DUF6807 family protein [Saccharothrix syringae]QFZ20131.1 hypothetical protein EKG83_24350 [Saccharothrix syringae]
MTPRVVLAGAFGYGRLYLREIAALEAAGRVELAGVCEVKALDEEARRLVGDRPVSADPGELLPGADIGIVSTPIHTHVGLAHRVLDAGAHLLLEKPPTATLADWRALVARAAGRPVQVGFQSLGSHAVRRLADLMGSGGLGEVRGIGVRGTWSRDDAYYTRAPWAGRRTLDGAPVVDGALTNPFAHGIATALALDGSTGVDDVDDIALELLRARDIEADDTSCLRLRTRRGTVVVVAVTLCAEVAEEPVLVVHGSRRRAELHYTRHALVVDGIEERHGHDTPLANLLDHLADPAVPLNSPLTATGAFTRVLEEVRTAPEPLPIDSAWLRRNGDRVDVDGVDSAVTRAAERLRTFGELEVPWSPLGAAARYGWDRAALPLVVPRPALHPVRTLGGTVVTGEHPDDHPWHRGIGLALPDVNGVNLWGGRNYVPGRGYEPGELGVVRELAHGEPGPDELAWCDAGGRVLLRERRRVRRRFVEGGWELEWTSVLSADREVVLHSPGSKGRAGAGYGGWFWRLPDLDPATVHVFTSGGSGEDQVNGRPAPWLAVVVSDPQRPWTALVSGPTDPWFVRVRQYQGIGSALAWDRPLVLAPGQEREITVRVAFHDGVRPP